MNVNDMTIDDFEKIPDFRECTDETDVNREVSFNSIVIIPDASIHSSGYRNMNYVLVSKDGEPMFRLNGPSDVLHLNGIGGFGVEYEGGGLVAACGWRIDCLKTSGYLRLFSRDGLHLRNCSGYFGSSFEIYAN